ncbi:MAG: hypothetical protein RL220_304 [Bacteroidota bacterium]
MEQLPEGMLLKHMALHAVEDCRKKKTPIHGIEVFRYHEGSWETNLYKTIWFKSQRGVYNKSRDFLLKQMAGEWSAAEIKKE